MSTFRLQEASVKDGQAILSMLDEIGPGEQGFTNSAYSLNIAQFRAYLRMCERQAKGEGLERHHVPQTTHWFFCDDYPVGILKLRHYLNDNLRYQGGHIGYAIRPSERAKGYGGKMLAAALERAKALKIDDLLITVFESNLPSRKMVERNGGELESIKSGICYYWIKL